MPGALSDRPPRVLEDKGVAYAAKRLGCSPQNIYRLVEIGELPFVDVGAREVASKAAPATTRHRPTLRFLDEDLDAFITRRRVNRVTHEHTPETVATRAATPPRLRAVSGRYS